MMDYYKQQEQDDMDLEHNYLMNQELEEEDGWSNHGDVNPIEHGGFFIKKLDSDVFNRYYAVIEIINMSGFMEDEEGRWLVTDGRVDLDMDDWIDWGDALSVIGLEDEPRDEIDDTDLIYGAYANYGAENFGDINEAFSEQEVMDMLEAYGITEGVF